MPAKNKKNSSKATKAASAPETKDEVVDQQTSNNNKNETLAASSSSDNNNKQTEQQQEETNNYDEIQTLLIHCEERSEKRTQLNDAVRKAYVAIAESKMMLFAQHGGSSYLEFADAVKIGDLDDDYDFDEDDEGEDSATKNRFSREATFKLQCTGKDRISVDDDEKKSISQEDQDRALKVLSKESLKTIQERFREILVRAVDLSQS